MCPVSSVTYVPGQNQGRHRVIEGNEERADEPPQVEVPSANRIRGDSSALSQHAELTAERWATFSRNQQILMIGNEMNRGLYMLRLGDLPGLHRGYERVLRLVDLTIEVQTAYGLRRELSR
jgi:hypothetical protein